MLSSYSSPLAVGHRALQEADFFSCRYSVQEKIDGSQFSFGVQNGELYMRSRNSIIYSTEPPKMFRKAVDTVLDLFARGMLVDGYTYRGEVLQSRQHNTLTYDRAPNGNIVLFDVDLGNQYYATHTQLADIAAEFGVDCVPLYDVLDRAPTTEEINDWFSRESILGGRVEGVVLKSRGLYGQDKKVLMAKIVSEEFKEKHNSSWKDRNPNRNDVLSRIISEYGSEARWQKAVQHLGEQDKLTHSPQDIGMLMKELADDFEQECKEDICAILWSHFRKDIVRGIQKGFPEWYKEKLS